MKRIIYVLLAALLVISALSITVLAEDIAYISYNKGNNTNDGLYDTTPKKSLGTADGNGAFGLIKNGGTMVVSEKLYFGDNYTWKASGATTITAVYGGKDYKNTSPATNPASGVMKIKPACTLTVASDLTIDNIILFSESKNDTIIVTNGATLTITDSVITMAKSGTAFKIVVEAGAKAVINGGTFSAVSGDGDIKLGDKVTVGISTETPAASGAVAYISHNTGNNANDGLSDAAPKQGLGNVDGNGAASILKKGGTLVVSGKLYVGSSSYTWNVGHKVTVTANYGGKDYKNTEPASNPASGVIKFKPGCTFTVASDLVLDDVILFQENTQCTIVVAPGTTFTVNESVIAMSNREHYMNVIVTKGATAIINGGIFSSVSGEGTIKIGEKATVLGTAEEVEKAEPVKRELTVCYLDYEKGSNANDGSSADKAVKGYGDGVFARILMGGTVVLSGDSHIGGTGADKVYSMPIIVKPLTFTSVYGGVDYKNNASFYLSDNTTMKISSDVKFDNIVLVQKEMQNTIHVTNGATLTVTDTVEFRSEGDKHYNIIVDKGAIAILSEKAQNAFSVTGEGTVLTYTEGDIDIFKEHIGASTMVDLTIGSTTAYINGVAKTLDAAPINRNNRTMLPVRFLANAFGVSNDGIKWDAATRTATLSNASVTIVVTIDAPSMTVNGQAVALDSPAIIENNRTYLPVRAIANALGVSNDNIIWDGKTSTATLIK